MLKFLRIIDYFVLFSKARSIAGWRVRMQKNCLLIVVLIFGFLTVCESVLGEEIAFEYPYYLLDSYNPDGDSWTGMDPNGHWPVLVVPAELLVGEPPSLNVSGVTIPTDHWIELMFRGEIVDGPEDDIFMAELDSVGEQALVFLTDGSGKEYLLGYAAVPNTNAHGPKTIGFDISGISLPFAPRAVRILGIDLRGGSPGFDLAYVRARTYTDCRNTACNPSPLDGVLNVPVDTVLNWSPGYSAQKHVVFFGTSPNEISPNAAPVDNPKQPQDVSRFDPGGLELGKTYYWRIDEVNDTNIWTGEIWKFTVVDYVVVDDFESYSMYTLYHSWQQIDNASLYLSKDIEPVHNCRQALAFYYEYDTKSYSEAKYSFDSPKDLTSMGVKSVELFFYGLTNNDPYVQMYFVIDDGSTEKILLYDGDANNITTEAWQPWRIDVTNLTDVDLSHIMSVSIGFATSASAPMESGCGFVYFDDIRLYSSRCLEENRPKADFNGDCSVDFKDFEEIAGRWLDSGHENVIVFAPGTPLAWYKFDGNTNDNTGSSDGQIWGNPTFVPGVHGQALKFDGYEDAVSVSDATGIFSKINTGITIAFWANGTNSSHHTDTLFCTNYSYNLYNPTIAINLGCWKQPGRYNWDCGYPWSYDNRLSGEHRYIAEWEGRWNHWAFTKDTTNGKIQIYLNGNLFDSRNGANSTISGITSFQIGSGWYGSYDGLIDDFRIYDYALSQPEIAYIVTNGTGILDIPLITPADLFPDNHIDFKDFAILADSWLEKQLYP